MHVLWSKHCRSTAGRSCSLHLSIGIVSNQLSLLCTRVICLQCCLCPFYSLRRGEAREQLKSYITAPRISIINFVLGVMCCNVNNANVPHAIFCGCDDTAMHLLCHCPTFHAEQCALRVILHLSSSLHHWGSYRAFLANRKVECPSRCVHPRCVSCSASACHPFNTSTTVGAVMQQMFLCCNYISCVSMNATVGLRFIDTLSEQFNAASLASFSKSEPPDECSHAPRHLLSAYLAFAHHCHHVPY